MEAPTTQEYDIAAIMTVHNEGSVTAISWKSLIESAQCAEQQGYTVQKIIILDRADSKTARLYADLDEPNLIIEETDFGDQGKVRNHACQLSHAKALAFLDGDDLWGENWLRDAYTFLLNNGEKAIAHPEFSIFFGGISSVFINIDQDDPEFDPSFLRFANYWDALCMTWRSTHLAHPYCDREIANGFAFEDWHWNCETVANGFVHKVVQDTVHYKRRRAVSQTTQATGNRSLMPSTDLTSYRWEAA